MSRLRVSELEVVTGDGLPVDRQHLTRMLGYRRSPSGLIPPGVRAVGPGGSWWISEQPARWMNLWGPSGLPMRIPLPWMVVIVDTDLRLFARSTSLRSFDDSVFHLPLPGIDERGRIGLRPRATVEIDRVLRRLEERLESLTGEVVHSPFGVADESDHLRRWAEVPSLKAACELPFVKVGRLADQLREEPWASIVGPLTGC